MIVKIRLFGQKIFLEVYNVQGAVFQLIFMDITSSDLVLKMKYSGDIQSEVVIPDLL